jgi:hypothetical protein
MTSKWSQLQTLHHVAASHHKGRLFHSKSVSAGSGDTCMDQKVEEAYRLHKDMHVKFTSRIGTLSLYLSIVEKVRQVSHLHIGL